MLGRGDDQLSIYLNDHLAAATAGANLARHTAASNAGTGPGSNGLIAFRGHFTSCAFDQSAIGVIRPDGAGMHVVTGCEDIRSDARWSPDGTSILY